MQRLTVGALVLATLGASVAAYLVPRHGLHSRRSDRVAAARHRIGDSLRRRTYFLEDVADMVGVHDDAAAEEFARYAHVRGRDEHAVVAVQWIRHSPNGHLVPPVEVSHDPVLVEPLDRRTAGLADATSQAIAKDAVALADRRKQVAISPPVRLANGHAAFYLAVPVQARRYTGLLSRTESQSSVVGLVDAQRLVSEELAVRPTAPLRLRDSVTPLASVGSGLHNAVHVIVGAGGRQWTLSVDGGSLSMLERLLPALILLVGCGLALSVSVVLREAASRRDTAERLARERYDELEQARSEAERLSRVDAVTSVFNRRHFSELLAGELARARRGGQPPAVLLMDLDNFKRINDQHGHLAGDAALREAADRLASILRGSDCLARWGGEEFAILAPATDRDGAARLAERAREVMAERPFEVEDGAALELTTSVGVAVDGALGTPEALVNAADEALYGAKRAGRNRVSVHTAEGVAPARLVAGD
jgi:diguanylate cyclase (GGDEF)-like protein